MAKFKKLILGVHILVLAATLLAYLSPRTHPASSTIPPMMGLIFPVLLILNGLFILFWIALRKWYFLLSVACLIIGYEQIGAFIQFTPYGPRDSNLPAISMATYNVYSLRKMEQARPAEAMEEIRTSLGKPDILCVQESGGLYGIADKSGYPHIYAIPGSRSIILSNYPILGKGRIELSSGISLSGWVDLDISGDTVRLYLLHLTSNRITERTEELMEQGKLQDSDTWIEIGSLIRRYSDAAVVRSQQADEIRTHIEGAPHPVLVCGDFNDIPQSYTYTRIKGDMQDSFIKRGSGVGATYAGKVPGLRIDYILAGENFEVARHDIVKLPFSDHYPVLATVRIRDL